MKGFIFEKIFKAAKGLGITTFSIPHGLNIYTNSDIHYEYIKNLKKGILPNFSQWNSYDHVVVQTKYHKDHLTRFGLDRSRVNVWGSLRFCTEWQKINSELYDKFTTNKDSGNKIKIVIMMPHWNYNINKIKTIDLVKKIIGLKDIYLVVKDHTRGSTGAFPKNEKISLIKKNNVEFDICTSSTSLINWSDIVINFGSSIGIEAIDKNKPTIYPKYLHSNKSIHDEINVTHNASKEEEVIQTISDFKSNKLNLLPKNNKSIFLSTVVYGGKEPYNVIDFYYSQILKISSTL